MERTYKIQNYSSFDNWTVHSCGANMSDVFDKLLRIATKVTERFASDILYLMPVVKRAMDDGVPVDMVIMFRECGVSWREADADDTVTMESYTNYHQVWRLSIPGGLDAGEDASLTRVTLAWRGPYNTEVIGG